jgi:hypothetical protein
MSMATILTGGRAKDAPKRDGYDFDPTPPEGTLAFVLAERTALAGHRVWEPACGDGRMVDALTAGGVQVIAASDVADRANGRFPLANFLDAPLPAATAEVFDLFPPDDWRWADSVHWGYWIDTDAVVNNAGRYRGYRQLRALQDRGLIELRSLAPWQWQGDACTADWRQSEHFCRLTPAGVIYRNRLDGRQWAYEVEP